MARIIDGKIIANYGSSSGPAQGTVRSLITNVQLNSRVGKTTNVDLDYFTDSTSGLATTPVIGDLVTSDFVSLADGTNAFGIVVSVGSASASVRTITPADNMMVLTSLDIHNIKVVSAIDGTEDNYTLTLATGN